MELFPVHEPFSLDLSDPLLKSGRYNFSCLWGIGWRYLVFSLGIWSELIDLVPFLCILHFLGCLTQWDFLITFLMESLEHFGGLPFHHHDETWGSPWCWRILLLIFFTFSHLVITSWIAGSHFCTFSQIGRHLFWLEDFGYIFAFLNAF